MKPPWNLAKKPSFLSRNVLFSDRIMLLPVEVEGFQCGLYLKICISMRILCHISVCVNTVSFPKAYFFYFNWNGSTVSMGWEPAYHLIHTKIPPRSFNLPPPPQLEMTYFYFTLSFNLVILSPDQWTLQIDVIVPPHILTCVGACAVCCNLIPSWTEIKAILSEHGAPVIVSLIFASLFFFFFFSPRSRVAVLCNTQEKPQPEAFLVCAYTGLSTSVQQRF